MFRPPVRRAIRAASRSRARRNRCAPADPQTGRPRTTAGSPRRRNHCSTLRHRQPDSIIRLTFQCAGRGPNFRAPAQPSRDGTLIHTWKSPGILGNETHRPSGLHRNRADLVRDGVGHLAGELAAVPGEHALRAQHLLPRRFDGACALNLYRRETPIGEAGRGHIGRTSPAWWPFPSTISAGPSIASRRCTAAAARSSRPKAMPVITNGIQVIAG